MPFFPLPRAGEGDEPARRDGEAGEGGSPVGRMMTRWVGLRGIFSPRARRASTEPSSESSSAKGGSLSGPSCLPGLSFSTAHTFPFCPRAAGEVARSAVGGVAPTSYFTAGFAKPDKL